MSTLAVGRPLRGFLLVCSTLAVFVTSPAASSHQIVAPADPPRAVAQNPLPPHLLQHLRTDVRQAEYCFAAASEMGTESCSAPNRANGLRSRICAQGLQVFPRTTDAQTVDEEWMLHLRTVCVGRLDAARELPPARLSFQGPRAELDHQLLRESFVNDEQGLEQSWEITAAPAGDPTRPLWIELDVQTELSLVLDSGGRSARFLDGRGRSVLHYRGLAAWDATGRALEARLESREGAFGVRVEDCGAAYPVTVDPVLSGPTWVQVGEYQGDEFGSGVTTAGDVNGDGYVDVVVGAAFAGFLLEGRAYLYLGGPTGLTTSAAWTADGPTSLSRFGRQVACAGDVNGDGFADVLVGASVPEEVQLFRGSPIGLSATSAWTLAGQGDALAPAGDVNGDGFGDVIVGQRAYDAGLGYEGRARVFLGSSAGLSTTAAWSFEGSQASAQLGNSVACAGDVNADGFSDVVVGASGADQALLFLGSPTGLGASPAWTGTGGSGFGLSIAPAGDVNGDGHGDVVVGAFGRAHVFLGDTGGLAATPVWSAQSAQPANQFGAAVHSAGDVNGDGYGDLLIGDPYHSYGPPPTRQGAAYVYLGSPAGPEDSYVWRVEGGDDFLLGASVSPAGDVDGDGYGDILVGAPFQGYGEGFAYLYSGSAVGPHEAPDWTRGEGQSKASFGWQIASAGDVNGDGFGDVVVGAPDYDAGEVDEGRAFLYLGSTSGPTTPFDWAVEGNQVGAQLGCSVASAGDVNGDGYGDVAVGARLFDGVFADAGGALVYLGSPAGLTTVPAWTQVGSTPEAWFGASVAAAGDVNGDGYGDLAVGAPQHTDGELHEGAAFVFHGSPSGLATAAAWTLQPGQAEAFLGHAVAAAGDVNRDGYGDLIVSAPRFDGAFENEGRVLVFHGTAAGLSASAAWTTGGGQAFATYGSGVSTAGDVNGDGFSDVLVGARGYSGGQTREGRADIYLGGPAGLATAPVWSVEAEQPRAQLGHAVAAAGDVNGDGYGDVLIGAPFFDEGQWDEGHAFLYLGGAFGPGGTPAWHVQSNETGANLGWSVAGSGDLNGDGFADVLVGALRGDFGATNEGLVHAWLGNEGRGSRTEAVMQLRLNRSAPIALHGLAGLASAFSVQVRFTDDLATFAWLEQGPVHVALEWEVKPVGVPFDGTGLQRSNEFLLEAPLLLEGLVIGLDPGTAYAWRARVVTTHPLLPHTRWFGLAGNTVTEAKLRTMPTGTYRVKRDFGRHTVSGTR